MMVTMDSGRCCLKGLFLDGHIETFSPPGASGQTHTLHPGNLNILAYITLSINHKAVKKYFKYRTIITKKLKKKTIPIRKVNHNLAKNKASFTLD